MTQGRHRRVRLRRIALHPVPRKRKVAVVALGQIGSTEKTAIPTVLGAVTKAVRTDASPIVREQAAIVIGQMKTEDAVAALNQKLG